MTYNEQEPIPSGKPLFSRTMVFVIVGGVIGLLALTFVGIFLQARDSQEPERRSLSATQQRCDAAGAGTTVQDDGNTLVVNSIGADHPMTGVDTAALRCIFDDVKMPSFVSEAVWATRALDGRQEDSWPGYTAAWSYHPDSGLRMIIRAV